MSAPALSAIGVRKAYAGIVALAGVDLVVQPGTIVGLLGPNGAGKTTFVSIVAGLRRPDAGSVHVCGVDVRREPRRARQAIGIAPQDTGVYLPLSVRDNLTLFAGLAGLRGRGRRERIDETAAALGMTHLLHRRAGELSGGERRRLHAAIALVHRPALVLLDEPTVGADVQTRGQILDLVRSVADAGSAVVYSTHYLHEIEQLDASVAFLDHGRIVARGTLAALLGEYGTSALELTFVDAVPKQALVEGAVVAGTTVRVPTDDPAATAARVLAQLGGASAALTSIEILRPSLESVFVRVTGREYAGEAA
jgi:ABC-2 type transport system ATP-binding protein